MDIWMDRHLRPTLLGRLRRVDLNVRNVSNNRETTKNDKNVYN